MCRDFPSKMARKWIWKSHVPTFSCPDATMPAVVTTNVRVTLAGVNLRCASRPSTRRLNLLSREPLKSTHSKRR